MLRDPEPQTASGKVLWHFSMTLDGFIAGPEHSFDWMTGFTGRPGIEEEYVQTTGAVLCGRDAFDSAMGDSRPYGDDWKGSIFMLTHHPEDATPAEGITILSCDVGRGGADRARGGRRQEPRGVLGEHRPAAARTRADRRDRPAHRAGPARRRDPAVRQPGGAPLLLDLVDSDDPTREVDLRYRVRAPAAT